MNVHGYPWISMDIHGYPWISMDIHEYPLILGQVSDPVIQVPDPFFLQVSDPGLSFRSKFLIPPLPGGARENKRYLWEIRPQWFHSFIDKPSDRGYEFGRFFVFLFFLFCFFFPVSGRVPAALGTSCDPYSIPGYRFFVKNRCWENRSFYNINIFNRNQLFDHKLITGPSKIRICVKIASYYTYLCWIWRY